MSDYDSLTEIELTQLAAKTEDEFIALKAKRKEIHLARAKKEQERHASIAAQNYTVEELEAILEAKKKAQAIGVLPVPPDEGVGA